MAEHTPSDARIAAALRQAVGEVPSDINLVLARGSQARTARVRRTQVMTVLAGVAVVVAVLAFGVLHRQPSEPQPIHAPRHSTHGIWSGTYATDPLPAATLIRHGMKSTEIQGSKTVLTLTFEPLMAGQKQGRQNGTYTQYDAEDGGPLKKGDTGAFAVRGRTITFVSSYRLQRTTYRAHITADGFRLRVEHFFFTNPTDRRIARVIWTAAAFHRS